MLPQTIRLYEDRLDVTLTTYLWSDSPVLQNGRKRTSNCRQSNTDNNMQFIKHKRRS